MNVRLPQSVSNLVRLTLKGQNFSVTGLYDQSHKSVDLELPAGVTEDEVEVTAVFCNGRGQPVDEPQTLKHATVKPRAPQVKPVAPKPPEVKVEPKAEAKVEPKVEVKVEPKVEAKVEPKAD